MEAFGCERSCTLVEFEEEIIGSKEEEEEDEGGDPEGLEDMFEE